VRVTVQLIESETRTRLRADRYDGTPDEVFDLQDRITASVVGWSSRIFGGPRSSARGASAPTVSALAIWMSVRCRLCLGHAGGCRARDRPSHEALARVRLRAKRYHEATVHANPRLSHLYAHLAGVLAMAGRTKRRGRPLDAPWSWSRTFASNPLSRCSAGFRCQS
jgi:hypothetical protein